MKSSIILRIAALLAAICLSGCASMGSSNTKSLLVAAGFREKVPETAKQKELYASVPSYHLQHVQANGKSFYAYKDEKNGTALVGDDSNYQQYEKLAIQQQIATQQYQAAEMQRDMAMGWYGAYGPGVYGRPGGRYGYYR